MVVGRKTQITIQDGTNTYITNYSYDNLGRLDRLTDRISALQWCTSKIKFPTVYSTKLAFRVYLQNYNNQSFIFEAKKNFYFKT